MLKDTTIDILDVLIDHLNDLYKDYKTDVDYSIYYTEDMIGDAHFINLIFKEGLTQSTFKSLLIDYGTDAVILYDPIKYIVPYSQYNPQHVSKIILNAIKEECKNKFTIMLEACRYYDNTDLIFNGLSMTLEVGSNEYNISLLESTRDILYKVDSIVELLTHNINATNLVYLDYDG